jgi:hypothetical protein
VLSKNSVPKVSSIVIFFGVALNLILINYNYGDQTEEDEIDRPI